MTTDPPINHLPSSSPFHTWAGWPLAHEQRSPEERAGFQADVQADIYGGPSQTAEGQLSNVSGVLRPVVIQPSEQPQSSAEIEDTASGPRCKVKAYGQDLTAVAALALEVYTDMRRKLDPKAAA